MLDAVSAPSSNRRGPRRRLRFLLKFFISVLAVLLILLALAPAILSLNFVKDAVLRRLNRGMEGSVEIDSWSISWSRGISLEGVSLKNAEGTEVGKIASAKAGLRWMGLLARKIDLGEVVIERPEIRLEMEKEGFGLPAPRPQVERIRAPEKRSKVVSFHVVVREGSVFLVSRKGGTEIRDISLEATLLRDGAPVEFSCDFVTESPEGEGRFQAGGSLDFPQGLSLEGGFPSGEISIRGSSVNLALLAPLLRRGGRAVEISGLADLSLDARFEGKKEMQADGQVALRALSLSGEALRGDTLEIPKVDLNLSLSLSQKTLSVERFDCKSGVVSFTAQGALPRRFIEKGVLPAGGGGNFSASVDIDVAMLGNSLPHLFHLAEGTRLTAGRLTASLSIEQEAGGWLASGELALSDLSAKRAGKSYRLRSPVKGKFSLGRSAEGFSVRDAQLLASFGKIGAKTEGKKITLESQLDLDILQEELSQFFDFGEVALSGKVESLSKVDMSDPGKWLLESKSDFSRLMIAGFTHEPVEEEKASVTFSGAYTPGVPGQSLEIGELDVKSSSLSARLSGFLKRGGKRWLIERLQGSAKGDIALVSEAFSKRLGGARFSGGYRSDFHLEKREKAYDFSVSASFSNLVARGFLKKGKGGSLQATSAQISLDGSWSKGSSSLLLVKAFSVKTDFAEAAGSAKFFFEQKGFYPSLALEKISCDLGELASKSEGIMPEKIRFEGKVNGSGRISKEENDHLGFEISLASESFRVSEPPGGTIFFEDNLKASLSGLALKDGAFWRFSLSSIEISSSKYPELLRLEGEGNFIRTDGSLSLDAEVAAPVALSLPILGRTLKRLEGISGGGDLRWKGRVSFERNKVISIDGSLELESLDLTVPRAGQHAFTIKEPALDARVKLDYVFASRDLRVGLLSLKASGIDLSSRFSYEDIGKEPLPTKADVSLDVDLAEFLSRYAVLIKMPADLSLSGKASARFDVSTTNGRTKAKGTIRLDKFIAKKGGSVYDFASRPIRIEADLSGERAVELLELKSFLVDFTFCRLEASGKVSNYRSTRDINLNLLVDYDLAEALQFFGKSVPEGLILEGKRRESFRVAGRIVRGAWRERLAALDVKGRFGFDRFRWKGLEIAKMEIPFSLKDGLLSIEESTGTLGQGNITISGSVDLTKTPPVYALNGPLTVLKDMRLRKEIEFIRFLHPIFGNFAEIDGFADIVVSSARVPLSRAAPDQAEAAGEVLLRDLRVRQSLLLARLLDILGGGGQELQEISPTRFLIKDGRIHFEETTLRYAGQVLGFAGSVGFDETLDLEARVLVTERILGKDKALITLLTGQKIAVPIGGTLDDPKVGEKIFRKNLKRLVGGAMKRAFKIGVMSLFDITRAVISPEQEAAPSE